MSGEPLSIFTSECIDLLINQRRIVLGPLGKQLFRQKCNSLMNANENNALTGHSDVYAMGPNEIH